MRVRTFDRETQTMDLIELRYALSFRIGTIASFWLNEGGSSSLAILVNDKNACVHYFPGGEHPGFYAAGLNQDWENHIEFVADNHETMEVPFSMVIPWSTAVTVAEEYFQAHTMPSVVTWREL